MKSVASAVWYIQVSASETLQRT